MTMKRLLSKKDIFLRCLKLIQDDLGLILVSWDDTACDMDFAMYIHNVFGIMKE